MGYYERTQPFSIDLWVKAAQVYEDVAILHHRETENAGNAGYTSCSSRRTTCVGDDAHARGQRHQPACRSSRCRSNEWVHIAVTYDGSSRAPGTTMYLNGVRRRRELTRDNLTRTIIPNGNANQATRPRPRSSARRLRAQPMKGGAIDEVRVFRTALTPVEVRYLHTQVSGRPRDAAGADRSAGRQRPRVEQALVALTSARNVENELVSVLPQIMIMGETPTPRPTYVLVRGNYEDHGEQVPPRGLNQVLPWDPAWPENRVGLARWLFDARNPLTSRVFVNRAWQMHFGRGLVETAEDFGSQGSIPTHPELLDSLACPSGNRAGTSRSCTS